MTDSHTSLRSQLLIAMPSLHDNNFNKSITLICDHSPENGAMGIVLNQPTSLNIFELLNMSHEDVKDDALTSIRIHSGGPVDTDHGFILHDSEYEHDATIQVTEKVFLTSSTDILEDIAQGVGPQNKIIVLGYAGWAPGQLENEIATNAWLTTDFNHDLIFSTPAEQQWLAAGKLLGIDLNLVSNQAGHA